MKQCATCKEIKPLSAFSTRKRQGRTDYPQSSCKVCHSQYRRDHYVANQEKYRAKASRNKTIYRAACREVVATFLHTHPCVDCGEADPVVLEFDHVRGEKKFNISKYVSEGQSPNIRVLKIEIAKCEVRCANCHRRVTVKRRNRDINIAGDVAVFQTA